MFEAESSHPNRRPFKGILAKVDKPSNKEPHGSGSRRLILTRQAAEAAMPGLIGMAVNFKDDWSGHNHKQKCGVITNAWIEGTDVMVSGFIYAKDFPEVIAKVDSGAAMGMSYELADTYITRERIGVITRTIFTGAAILLRDKACYLGSSFKLAAA